MGRRARGGIVSQLFDIFLYGAGYRTKSAGEIRLKEQEAFRRIQVQSMNTRKSMREIAEAIIIAHNV
ncbi:MAG TPA: ANTAR domain-containing protein [Chthonomonadaceae bacterium]|nr:ANTAR domain-containing protein [Chthonomonadaceae bacterium]